MYLQFFNVSDLEPEPDGLLHGAGLAGRGRLGQIGDQRRRPSSAQLTARATKDYTSIKCDDETSAETNRKVCILNRLD